MYLANKLGRSTPAQVSSQIAYTEQTHRLDLEQVDAPIGQEIALDVVKLAHAKLLDALLQRRHLLRRPLLVILLQLHTTNQRFFLCVF